MSRPFLRVPLVVSCLALAASIATASDLTVDGRTRITKLMGSPGEIQVTGAANSTVWLLVDSTPGPVQIFGQTLELGLTPALIIEVLGSTGPGGSLDVPLVVPSDPAFDGITGYIAVAVLDQNAQNGFDFSNGVAITVADRNMELAGNSLAQYPHFEFVRAFNEGANIEVTVDASVFPEIDGRSGDVYVVDAKTRDGWIADATLTDVTGNGPDAVSFNGATIAGNAFVLDAGTLDGDAGIDLGVPYDVVIDLNTNGVLDADDFIDGYSDEAGLYVVKDTTLGGPLAVTEALYSGGSFLGQNLFYPTDIASFDDPLPLVVVSHGNGHNYQWYDHIGNHLASHGFIVMSHQNNTIPGIETASTTTLTNTDYFLGNLATIQGGILDGRVDSSRMTWMGHSRGGEGVARAYDRIFDGTWTPVNYTIDDIVLVSSIAPTNFLGTNSANPHGVNYHLWTGGADADVNGCANTNIVQTFQLHDRAERERLSISLHGVGHGDFHNSSGSVASGPCLVGKTNTHAIVRGYVLPLVKHYAEGNLPAKDFLWRQWERFRPIGAPTSGCVHVDLMYREGPDAGKLVVDDFWANTALGTSSSGGAVTATVSNRTEGRPDDNNTTFTHNAADPFNGFTSGSGIDTTRVLAFEYNQQNSEIVWDLVPAAQDARDFAYLSFRACQSTRHPLTTAHLGDTVFTVELADGSGRTSAIRIDAYGGGIEEPYQRTSCGSGAGWANEFETVRLRLADFLHDGNEVDLADLASVTLRFGPAWGTRQGRLGFDDLEFTKD